MSSMGDYEQLVALLAVTPGLMRRSYTPRPRSVRSSQRREVSQQSHGALGVGLTLGDSILLRKASKTTSLAIPPCPARISNLLTWTFF
jgi:hypothetical protein